MKIAKKTHRTWLAPRDGDPKSTERYFITSKAGHEMGHYWGESPIEALCEMHYDAGYDVKLSDNRQEIVFCDDETALVCGHLQDWHITQA